MIIPPALHPFASMEFLEAASLEYLRHTGAMESWGW
jgi:hypothetical protein